jgi:hypothetical protein
MRASPGAIFEREGQESKTKKPARRLAFLCPKAGEELLLCSGSSGRGGSGSGSRSGSGGGGRSGSGSGSRSSSGSGSRSGGSSGSRSGGSGGSSFSRLRSFSSGLRCLDRRLRGFGFATSGHSQGEEGSYEERLLHLRDP